jgi:class 3 adenylate cyclase
MAAIRRLAAILAANVAGYSRLMGADEEGTLERLNALRHELVDPKIAEHHGRIVKTTGDGVLVEFASVLDAVRCVVETQRAMLDHEADVAEDGRIRFRIGINLGDIIAEGDDIFGDGVNVAARPEALAEPGGVCISRVVRPDPRQASLHVRGYGRAAGQKHRPSNPRLCTRRNRHGGIASGCCATGVGKVDAPTCASEARYASPIDCCPAVCEPVG